MGRLAGADMVAGSGRHDMHAVAARVEERREVRGHLRHGVQVVRSQGRVFGEGVGAGYAPIDFCGGDDEHARRRGGGMKRLEQVDRPQEVHGKHEFGVDPAHGDERDAREVDAGVRRQFRDQLFQSRGVPKIDRVNLHRERVCGGGLDRIAGQRRVTGAHQFVEDMSSDEPARACHEDSHGYALIWAL